MFLNVLKSLKRKKYFFLNDNNEYKNDNKYFFLMIRYYENKYLRIIRIVKFDKHFC